MVWFLFCGVPVIVLSCKALEETGRVNGSDVPKMRRYPQPKCYVSKRTNAEEMSAYIIN